MSHLDLTQVGKYQILDLVGEGAMGAVYRALDPVLNRVVAIKVMGDAVARNAELRDRFLREAQAAGSLQHPNVITIFDFGEVDGHLFIAMEYLEGNDLEHILEQRAPLSIADKLDIAIDVLSGLAFAHKRGFVHRDVKPANIRVTEDGRAKIMDFGIVHLESSRMTRTGIAMGTPDYMAPEQVTGDRITPATDIFAMGSVLYELLTGARPFRAETLHSVLYKIVSEEPPAIDTVLPGLPAQLVPVIARAMAKAPAARYASALDFANALTEVRASLAGGAPTTRTLSLRTSIDSGLAEAARVRASAPTAMNGRARALRAGGIAAGALIMVTAGWLIATRGSMPTTTTADGRAELAGAAQGPPLPLPPPSTPAPAARPAPSQSDELQVAAYRALATTLAGARQRAVAAGVPRERLAEGDLLEQRATTLLGEGRVAQARLQLARAANSWSAAERRWLAEPSTRAAAPTSSAAAPASGAASAASVGAPTVTATPPVAPPVVVQPPAPAPRVSATLPPPEIDPSIAAEAGIAAAVASYARAIESRDLAAVRRANPGLTAVQQTGFEQFFRATRSVRATFTVQSTEIVGTTAEARLGGAYDFVTTSGKAVHQPLGFQATLRREGGTWRLVAVR